jgi:hypothetical protein
MLLVTPRQELKGGKKVKDRKIGRKLYLICFGGFGKGHHAPVLQVLIGCLFEKRQKIHCLSLYELEDVRILLTE